MKVAQNISHDDKTYKYGDDISAEDAKALPEGYVMSDGEYEKAEEERAEAGTASPLSVKPVEEMTAEEIANHPSQTSSTPPAEPVIEDGALVSPQPVPVVEVEEQKPAAKPSSTDKK